MLRGKRSRDPQRLQRHLQIAGGQPVQALRLRTEAAAQPGGRQLQFREQRGPDTPLLARQAAVRLGFDYSDAIPVADTHPASA